MNFSNEQLVKFLLETNRRLKRLKSVVRKIRKQRNILQTKLDEIETLLEDVNYYYDNYDHPSDSEMGRLLGKVELKKDLLKIINRQ